MRCRGGALSLGRALLSRTAAPDGPEAFGPGPRFATPAAPFGSPSRDTTTAGARSAAPDDAFLCLGDEPIRLLAGRAGERAHLVVGPDTDERSAVGGEGDLGD